MPMFYVTPKIMVKFYQHPIVCEGNKNNDDFPVECASRISRRNIKSRLLTYSALLEFISWLITSRSLKPNIIEISKQDLAQSQVGTARQSLFSHLVICTSKQPLSKHYPLQMNFEGLAVFIQPRKKANTQSIGGFSLMYSNSHMNTFTNGKAV